MKKPRSDLVSGALLFAVGSSAWSRIRPGPSGTRKRKIDLAALVQDVRHDPDAYQYERAARFGVAPNAIFQAIVMDNAVFHKRADTKAAIETAGHGLEYLPPYAPDLNPIAHEWAQARAIRRKTGKTTEQILMMWTPLRAQR